MQNYFEFYGLPIQLNLNLALLKQKFFEISRTYHPDLFANATPSEQEEALQISTKNTVWYKTLSNENSRLEHVVQLYRIENNEALPTAFLGQMMDLNEQIDEVTNDTRDDLVSEIMELKNAFYTEMFSLFEKFDESTEANKTSILLTLNQLHLKNKYLLRLNESLNTFAAE